MDKTLIDSFPFPLILFFIYVWYGQCIFKKELTIQTKSIGTFLHAEVCNTLFEYLSLLLHAEVFLDNLLFLFLAIMFVRYLRRFLLMLRPISLF